MPAVGTATECMPRSVMPWLTRPDELAPVSGRITPLLADVGTNATPCEVNDGSCGVVTAATPKRPHIFHATQTQANARRRSPVRCSAIGPVPRRCARPASVAIRRPSSGRCARAPATTARLSDSPNRLTPRLRSWTVSAGETRYPPSPTPVWERRLIARAKRGDRPAQAELFALYEPLVRRIAGSLYLPGGDRDDLAQCARLGILRAARWWDPARPVPFRAFAWLCAVREARAAVESASSGKNQALDRPRSLNHAGGDGLPLSETIEAAGRPDEDPVAKTL